jgi:large subunit ribosomal protein L3
VTVIEAGPCYVTQIKTQATDGYNAVQIGFGPPSASTSPNSGTCGSAPVTHLREIRTDDVDQYEVGQVVDVSQFAAGDLVDVTGHLQGQRVCRRR